jgi:NAD(P)-dependent dehydrogenase (short-subunit alcohol dehydrogenase family)
MLLEGKSCVITGAGSGVGRAAALVFAREGAKVVCSDVMEDWAKETMRLVEEQGGTAAVAACDVTKESDLAGAIAVAVSSFGRLDVMFNNAGVATPPGAGTFETYDDAAWDRLMSINLRGIFYGMKQAVLQFKAQGTPGAIVNTASAAGMVGWGGTVYGTTKGGVIQMTRAVAIEAAPFDIRVNAICPAAMPTTNFGVHDPSQAFQEKSEQHISGAGQFHPLGRHITPEDCAEAASFLASDRARNITGVLLPVDGGYTAR